MRDSNFASCKQPASLQSAFSPTASNPTTLPETLSTQRSLAIPALTNPFAICLINETGHGGEGSRVRGRRVAIQLPSAQQLRQPFPAPHPHLSPLPCSAGSRRASEGCQQPSAVPSGCLIAGLRPGASLLHDRARERETLHTTSTIQRTGLESDISFLEKLISQFTPQR